MRIIGIDQSFRSTGIVILDEGDKTPIYFGTIRTTAPRFYNPSERMGFIALEICKLIDEYKPDIMRMEHYSMGSVSWAAKDLAALMHIIILYVNQHTHIKFENIVTYMPTELKKFATGCGTAGKDYMVKFLPKGIEQLLLTKSSKTTGLYDLTDAYHIALYGFVK